MKTKATILSIIISIVTIFFITLFTSAKSNEQTLQFSNPVTVENNTITSKNPNPIYFEPVGEKCCFTIDISGMDQFISNIKITTGSPENEPVYKTSAVNTTLSTGEINVDNKSIFVVIEPEIKEKTLENEEYLISYTVILKSYNSSGMPDVMSFIVASLIIIFEAFIIFMVNKNADKDYDERQLKARGSAAMNALIVTIIVAFGIGAISRTTDNFPLSVYEVGFIVCLTGVLTFLIIADLNDAFIGLRGKRFPLALVYTIVGVMELLMSGFYNLIFKVGAGHELSVVTFISGLYFTVLGVEMIVHGIIEKKEAKEDEES